MALSMAMIALGPKPRISGKAIQTELLRQWPSLPPPTDAAAKDNTFSFRVGSLDVITGLMPAPIPWSDLEVPCKSSLLWKEAATVLKGHKSHLIVTVSGEEPPVERLRLLTQVVASILAACPQALGVFWTHAELVVQPPLFRDFAIEVLERPLYIWLSVRAGKNAADKTAGFTIGMESLGHMEFETEDASDSPGDLRERFLALANYVLDNGAVIRDGDTIGEDANERIKVVYAKSAFGREGKVMRLEYSPVKGKKAWWQPW